MKVTGTRSVWVTNPTLLLRLNPEKVEAFLDGVTFLGAERDDMKDYGWVKVGMATVTCTVERSHSDLMQDGATAVREAITKHDAESQRKRTELEQALHKFLAVGWEGDAL